MKRSNYLRYGLGVAAIAAVALSGERAFAQDPNSAPNSYRLDDSWSAKLPEGRKFGQVIALEPDRDGKSVWVFDRCGGTSCSKSNAAPIPKFDAAGNVVVKFAPDGKVLMTIGKTGMSGEDEGYLDRPTGVAIAANGDIFISDGHGASAARRKASSTPCTVSCLMPQDAFTLPTVGTAASRSLMRMASSSLNGSSSAARAAWRSTRTASSMWPTISRTRKPILDSNRGSGPARFLTARSRALF